MSEIYEAWAVYHGYYRYQAPNPIVVPWPWKRKHVVNDKLPHWMLYSDEEIKQFCKQEMEAL